MSYGKRTTYVKNTQNEHPIKYYKVTLLHEDFQIGNPGGPVLRIKYKHEQMLTEYIERTVKDK